MVVPHTSFKRIMPLLGMCWLCCFLGVSVAQADARLAAEKNCMACHDVSAQRLGPPFREIAIRYAGQKDATERMAGKIIKGGEGAWGNVRMPANTQISEQEARRLAVWVLGLR
jgi:cytochrome c